MAWLNKLNIALSGRWSLALSAVVVASAVLTGCNVGKTDTTTGSTTTGSTTTTSTSAAKSCAGSYVGNYGPPDHDERIRLRNLSLANRGIPVTGNDDIDNANAGGGSPDGGIWMGGSYSFETDGNCNITSGSTFIFYAYEYGLYGTVVKGAESSLIWSGQGSQGDMKITVDANNNISGKFFHPAPDNFVYGIISGTFTPR